MKVVYFDGYCNVCNRFVDFLLRRDPRGVLTFSSLQGKYAAVRLPPALTTSELNTMAFHDGDVLYVESSAAIRAIAALGGVWSLMKVFLIVPSFLRDMVYRWVANHRYLWFGKRETCRLATSTERARFLD